MGTTEPNLLAAILFAELADPGPLTQRDEPIGLELIEEHHQILRDIFPMFRGQEIKSGGGGMFVEFGSGLAAVQCAVEIQRTLAERNEKKSEERQIPCRIGIHCGRVGERDGDEPETVGRGARQVASVAGPGGICATETVYEQVGNQMPQTWIRLAPVELKQIPEAGVVYRWVTDATPEALENAEASRKQLYWLVLGVLVLNAALFLKFGSDRKVATTPSGISTNLPAGSGITNGR